jgi:hypothetical protein
MPGSSTALGRLLFALAVAFQLLTLGRTLFHPQIDPDTWWHLRVGQWIAEQGWPPTTDPFSEHGLTTGKPWYAYSWLFDWCLFRLYGLWSWNGVVLLRALCSVSVVYAWLRLVRRREGSALWTTALYVIGYFSFFTMTLAERPWLLSITFTIWTLIVVLNLRDGHSHWSDWLLPIGYIVWANWHIQFVYGLAVLGLGCAAPLLDRWFEFNTLTASTRRPIAVHPRRLLGLTLLCAAASVINPYHFRLFVVLADYASQPGAFNWVDELMAPSFRRAEDWLSVGLGALALVAAARDRRSAFSLLLVLGPAIAALRARRDEWFLATAAVAVLLEATPATELLGTLAPLSRFWKFAFPPVLIVLACAGSLRIPPASFEEQERLDYPRDAVDHIVKHRLPGPLFNGFNWGGYLIFRLPEHPVALDGRTNLHEDARITASADCWLAAPGWASLPELRRARLILAWKRSPLTEVLRRTPGYRISFEDRQAIVFVKDATAPAD